MKLTKEQLTEAKIAVTAEGFVGLFEGNRQLFPDSVLDTIGQSLDLSNTILHQVFQPIKHAPLNREVIIIGGTYESYDTFVLDKKYKNKWMMAKSMTVEFPGGAKARIWVTQQSGLYIKAPTHFIDITKLMKAVN